MFPARGVYIGNREGPHTVSDLVYLVPLDCLPGVPIPWQQFAFRPGSGEAQGLWFFFFTVFLFGPLSQWPHLSLKDFSSLCGVVSALLLRAVVPAHRLLLFIVPPALGLTFSGL